MNTKLIKGILALTCTCGGLVLSFRGHPISEAVKNAKPVAANSQELVISDPEKPADYGIGTYKVEGVLAKGAKVAISLDDKEVQNLTANTEDGNYDIEVEVSEPGKHVLVAQFKDSTGKQVSKKLEFTASNKKFGGEKTVEELSANNAESASSNGNNVPVPDKPIGELKVDTNSQDDSNSTDPNSPANRKAGGVHDEVIKPNHEEKPVHKEPTKPTVAKVAFVLSSHTNFNVVPHGIIKIGGKGKAGDKVMLLVDGKPSMRGTIKADGRWTFPVKVARPGFRRITAQNLTSREAKSVKLKIK